MNVERIYQELQQHFPEDLETVRNFLRTPSISYTGQGIRETAENVATLIRSLGGQASIVETAGHPVVYGEVMQDAPLTVLIYGMYDVMPVDEDGWIAEPFGAEIHDLPEFGECIICRGAVNTKGPLAAFFTAMQAITRVEGRLPFNLLFAIEGEEEMGSRHFPEFIRQYQKKLERADVVLFPFFDQDEAGVPSLTLGTKGLFYMELISQGGEWGGPSDRGIHGSYNAWVKNPAWRLVRALASMVDDEENILIEGLKDGWQPMPSKEAELLDQQIDQGTFDAQTFREAYQVARLKESDDRQAWHRLFSEPQLNIDGLEAGYIGPETKTVLPHRAVAKVDVRMVPRMDPDQVERSIRTHLDRHGYRDIELKTYNKYPWSKVDLDSPGVQAMLSAYRELYGEAQLWPLNPGSAPYYVFERLLHRPYVTGGLGHGSRQHSSNEYCTVRGILDFEKSMVSFFQHLVTLPPPAKAPSTTKETP